VTNYALLNGLEASQQTGYGKYTALCPGGDDPSQSLAINKRADTLLSHWVDLLNDERDRELTPSQEQEAYAALREFIQGLPCEN
jgi:hypothetical protein